MKSTLKAKKPGACATQKKISSYFKTKTSTTSTRLFTIVDNEELTRLRSDDVDQIGPTPEAIAKKLFLNENDTKKATKHETKLSLFEEKSENCKFKSVKRRLGEVLSPSRKNPSKFIKKDTDSTKTDANLTLIEETQANKSKLIELESLTVIKETQFENNTNFVEETQITNEIKLESLSVIKETQLELKKIVDETQFNAKNSIDLFESLQVIKETQLNDNSMIIDETQLEESNKLDINSIKIIEETQLKNFNTENKENCEIDDQLLEYFDKLSPFKPQNKRRKAKSSLVPFLSGLSRHLVTNIQKSSREIILTVKSDEDSSIKTCKLKDFWTQTNVKINDFVNILSPFDSDQIATIDNSNGLIIVNPDHLISGTAVVSSLFCMRKAVLSEKFHSSEPSNFIMIIGSLIHQIFQEALYKQAFKSQELEAISMNILRHNSNLHDIFNAGSNEDEIMDEIRKFIPQIQSWFDKFILKPKYNGDFIKVTNIHDIEENIWSPRFGIKGKIDVTAQVEIHKRGKRQEKTIPIELKTGKSSFSPEHEGQVILYSMMSGDRRTDPEGGLLVYLRDGKTREVKAEHNHKRGLIQLRNELVHFIDQTVNSNEISIPSLPETLNNERLCSKCPYATVCCLYKSFERNNLTEDHSMHKLIPQFTDHLSELHKQYFIKWQHLLNLEASSGKNFSFLNAVYCQTSDEREKKGLGFSQMKIEPLIEETSNGLFMMKFRKTLQHENTDITIGEMVIISCEATKEFAIASGTVRDVDETFVQVEIDKNLSLRSDFSSIVFRLDRYSSGSIAAIAAGSLIKLIENNEKAAKLRRLIIDGDKPFFIDKLTDSVLKGKKILKSLNISQTRAVLKSLTAQDYYLIKGMPGTGKTSTIVALVRLLDLLGYSVLLTSHTHTAVDNILIKLKNYGIDFLRLGKCSKIHKEIWPFAAEKLVGNLKSVKELKDFYSSKKIYANTCLGSNRNFYGKKFDFCIVDEAAQIVQIISLGPLFHSERFILIGDPLQLPPLVQNKMAKSKGMDQSLFSLLDSPDTTIDLTVQYRMNEVIMNLANQLVYEGKLKCGCDSVAENTLKIQNSKYKSKIFSTLLKDSVIFINTDSIPALETNNNSGITNKIEAEIIFQIINEFSKTNFNMSEIGIISAYSAQVKYIRELLIKINSNVEVNTVDQYQGRDKEVIIVSFVRSTNSNKLGEILFDIRRINVAITRAKCKLILIGSITTLSNYPPLKKLIEIQNENIIHFGSSFHQFLY